MKTRSCLCAVAGALFLACDSREPSDPGEGDPKAPVSTAEPWFAEEAAARGVAFTWESGHGEPWYMPEVMGGGAALFDPDGDGDLDLYLVQGGSIDAPGANPPNRFFWNDGAGRFEDRTEESGAADRGYGMGACVGDVNGDGREDLYVTNVGPNVLLQNVDGEHFATASAGARVADDRWGTSAAFVDMDRDGDLDLYVCNYLLWNAAAEIPCTNLMGEPDYCSPKSYRLPAPDVLFVNEGAGVFADVSLESGIASLPGTGLGVVCADFDQDGWTDVFVANDGMPDRLWRNGGGRGAPGRFEDVAPLAGCAVDENGVMKAGMGVAVADVDGDGDPDLLVGNLNRESDSLYVNQGGWFADRTARAGLGTTSRGFTRFGLGLVDLDHDGFFDLYQVNGRVNRHALTAASDPYAEPNLLFRGSASGRFVEVLPRGGTAAPLVGTSRAAAFGDLDGDGDLDVCVVERDAPARLLINSARKSGRWVLLDVRETSGRAALGAGVLVTAGERTWRAEVRAASSYLASSDPRVHVGLGPLADVETLEVSVRWADGAEEAFGPLALDGVHTLRRGAGR